MKLLYAAIVIYLGTMVCSIFKKSLSKYVFLAGFPIIIVTNIILGNMFSGRILLIGSIILGILFYFFDVYIINHYIPSVAVSAIFETKNYNRIFLSLFGVIFSSIYEEMLWRQTLMVLGGGWLLSITMALMFALTHLTKRITATEVVCLFIFALFQNYFFMKYGSILNCIIVHIVRNTCVKLLQTKIEEIRMR